MSVDWNMIVCLVIRKQYEDHGHFYIAGPNHVQNSNSILIRPQPSQ